MISDPATRSVVPHSLAGSGGADAPPLVAKPKAMHLAKRSRERLVMISMFFVTAAIAAALYAQFDFSLAAAILGGGLAWVALMSMHMQVKRNAEIESLKAEIARFESQSAAAYGSHAGGMHAALHSRDAPWPNTGKDDSGKGDSGKSDSVKPAMGSPRRSAAKDQAAAPNASHSHASHPLAANSQAINPQTSTPSAAAPSSPAGSLAGPQTHPRWELPQTHSQNQPHSQAETHSHSQTQAQTTPGSSAVPAGARDASRETARRAPVAVETALWPGTALGAADPMRGQWAFRPSDADLKVLGLTVPLAQDHAAGMAADLTADLQILPLPGDLNSDLEMVQRKIKAMADEVNAAELVRDRPIGAPQSPAAATAMEKSIGALKATAETMRARPQAASMPASKSALTPFDPTPSDMALQALSLAKSAAKLDTPSMHTLPFELLIPATAERIAVSGLATAAAAPLPAVASPEVAPAPLPDLPHLPVFEFAPPPPPNPRLAAIVAAIENGSMDVFLSPIVALQSHQVSHYDVTVRLKAASGAYLDDAEQELQLAGSDMLALFDTARLKRSAALAQRLDAHNKSGSLLSAVNGPSITNADFLETFARVYEERDRISSQLVLTFTQADVEQFTASAWQALGDMHAFGFSFALSKIDHVAMDFSALAKRGFAFLRLDASALLSGLPARDRFVGPDDLCKLLAGAGMTLVADTIDDEAVRARVFGFGVLFGQGRLFGGARQVKLDPLPTGASAAA